MPLFNRSDGDLVRDLSPVRRMIPFVMRSRNASIVYHTARWDVRSARAWLRAFNRRRPAAERATLFHLLIHATAQTLHARPGLNRFVAGSHIYQRRGVWISFAAKQELSSAAPLVTIKLAIPQEQSFSVTSASIARAIVDAKAGRRTAIDREVRFLLRLPAPLLRIVIAAGGTLDRLNLLPRALIDPDPMFASAFLANLGSLRIDNVYHHLYEHGTCSVFGVVGSVKRDANRALIQVSWSVDERINDGFYCYEALSFMRNYLENPEDHLGSADEGAHLAVALRSVRTVAGSHIPVARLDGTEHVCVPAERAADV